MTFVTSGQGSAEAILPDHAGSERLENFCDFQVCESGEQQRDDLQNGVLVEWVSRGGALTAIPAE
jgi:hypothetical protein